MVFSLVPYIPILVKLVVIDGSVSLDLNDKAFLMMLGVCVE